MNTPKIQLKQIKDFSNSAKFFITMAFVAGFSITFWRFVYVHSLSTLLPEDMGSGIFALSFIFVPILVVGIVLCQCSTVASIYNWAIRNINGFAQIVPQPLLKAYYFSCLYFCFIMIPIFAIINLILLIALGISILFYALKEGCKFIFKSISDFFGKIISYHKEIDKL